MTTSTSESQEKVPVIFYTKTSAYVVSERPILVPVTSTPLELSDLVRHLIVAEGESDLPETLAFNFLFETVSDVQTLLRGHLKKMLLDAGWTLERNVRLEYFEASPEPQLQSAIQHPDWIKSISSSGSFFATGCYDGSVRIFSRASGDEPISTLNAHSLAVTGVSFISSPSVSTKSNRLVSVSLDQSAFGLHSSSAEESSFEKSFKLVAGEAFTCVAASRRGDFIASGSNSGKIFVYSGRREESADDSDEVNLVSASEEPAKKKSRKAVSKAPAALTTIKNRRPRFVLEGAHASTVTALIFDRVDNKNTGLPLLFSASLDGSIRAWDLSEQSFAFILSCDSPITSLAHHPFNSKLLLSGHPDGSVRFWDISEPLISSSALLPSTFFAGNPQIMKKRLLNLHKGWITALAWSPRDENLFVSAGHDGAVSIWDIRSDPSNPAPQYTIKSGNDLKDQNSTETETETETKNGKILAVDWSLADGFLRFGGEDCKLYAYSTK